MRIFETASARLDQLYQTKPIATRSLLYTVVALSALGLLVGSLGLASQYYSFVGALSFLNHLQILTLYGSAALIGVNTLLLLTALGLLISPKKGAAAKPKESNTISPSPSPSPSGQAASPLGDPAPFNSSGTSSSPSSSQRDEEATPNNKVGNEIYTPKEKGAAIVSPQSNTHSPPSTNAVKIYEATNDDFQEGEILSIRIIGPLTLENQKDILSPRLSSLADPTTLDTEHVSNASTLNQAEITEAERAPNEPLPPLSFPFLESLKAERAKIPFASVEEKNSMQFRAKCAESQKAFIKKFIEDLQSLQLEAEPQLMAQIVVYASEEVAKLNNFLAEMHKKDPRGGRLSPLKEEFEAHKFLSDLLSIPLEIVNIYVTENANLQKNVLTLHMMVQKIFKEIQPSEEIETNAALLKELAECSPLPPWSGEERLKYSWLFEQAKQAYLLLSSAIIKNASRNMEFFKNSKKEGEVFSKCGNDNLKAASLIGIEAKVVLNLNEIIGAKPTWDHFTGKHAFPHPARLVGSLDPDETLSQPVLPFRNSRKQSKHTKVNFISKSPTLQKIVNTRQQASLALTLPSNRQAQIQKLQSFKDSFLSDLKTQIKEGIDSDRQVLSSTLSCIKKLADKRLNSHSHSLEQLVGALRERATTSYIEAKELINRQSSAEVKSSQLLQAENDFKALNEWFSFILEKSENNFADFFNEFLDEVNKNEIKLDLSFDLFSKKMLGHIKKNREIIEKNRNSEALDKVNNDLEIVRKFLSIIKPAEDSNGIDFIDRFLFDLNREMRRKPLESNIQSLDNLIFSLKAKLNEEAKIIEIESNNALKMIEALNKVSNISPESFLEYIYYYFYEVRCLRNFLNDPVRKIEGFNTDSLFDDALFTKDATDFFHSIYTPFPGGLFYNFSGNNSCAEENLKLLIQEFLTFLKEGFADNDNNSFFIGLLTILTLDQQLDLNQSTQDFDEVYLAMLLIDHYIPKTVSSYAKYPNLRKLFHIAYRSIANLNIEHLGEVIPTAKINKFRDVNQKLASFFNVDLIPIEMDRVSEEVTAQDDALALITTAYYQAHPHALSATTKEIKDWHAHSPT